MVRFSVLADVLCWTLHGVALGNFGNKEVDLEAMERSKAKDEAL